MWNVDSHPTATTSGVFQAADVGLRMDACPAVSSSAAPSPAPSEASCRTAQHEPFARPRRASRPVDHTRVDGRSSDAAALWKETPAVRQTSTESSLARIVWPAPRPWPENRVRESPPAGVPQCGSIGGYFASPGRSPIELENIRHYRRVLVRAQGSGPVLRHRGADVLEESTHGARHPGELEHRAAKLHRTMTSRAYIAKNGASSVGLRGGVRNDVPRPRRVDLIRGEGKRPARRRIGTRCGAGSKEERYPEKNDGLKKTVRVSDPIGEVRDRRLIATGAARRTLPRRSHRAESNVAA